MIVFQSIKNKKMERVKYKFYSKLLINQGEVFVLITIKIFTVKPRIAHILCFSIH